MMNTSGVRLLGAYDVTLYHLLPYNQKKKFTQNIIDILLSLRQCSKPRVQYKACASSTTDPLS